MKSRSHRLPAYDPPDDWVNGSWTVDCVCGVNFDDGEEMVNCDECGVWVHTRCSRFVRGEKSFACDKCKSKNSRNDSEETEVAQLLVELPTKTMKMSSNSRCPMNNPPPRRPYRLWTDRPMEDRVHVQGIPGGDPSLFQGMSSIFTAELWKCSSYIPKKFNLQYREFPCWDKEKKVNDKAAEDSENMVDRGAGVLYSLSKDFLATAPDAALAGVRSQVDAGSSARKSQKGKRYEGLDAHNKGMQSVVEKERSLIRPIVIHSGKRKRDDTGTQKERTGKKKNKDHEIKKNRSSPALKTPFGPPTFGRSTESGSDKARIKVKKHGQGQEVPLTEAASAAAVVCDSGKLRSSPATKECNLGALSPGMVGHDYMTDKKVNLDKNRNGALEHVTCSHKTDDKLPSVGVQDDDDVSIPPKKEVTSLDNLENIVQTSPETHAVESLKSKIKVEELGSAPIKDSKDVRKSENGVLCLVHAMRRTAGDAGANPKGVQKSYSSRVDNGKVEGTEDLAENLVLSSNHISESCKTNDAGVRSSNSADQKLNQDKGNEAASDWHMEKRDDVPGMSSQARQVLRSECSMEKEKFSTESKQVIKGSEETSKLDVTVLSPSGSSSQRKLASFGKSVSSSSNVAISRSSSTDKYKSSSSQQSDPVIKRALSNSVIYTKKDNTPAALVRSDENHELLRSTAKERTKLSVNHAPKGQNPTKIPDSSLAKDFVKYPSSKTTPVERSSLPSTVAETGSSSKPQGTPVLQNKNIASPVQSKVEKGVKSNTLSSSKGSDSSLGHAAPSSTPPAGLSDEELALLLHQELNSSLRVPRIPRVRQAGSLPQLSPVAGTNVSTKRSPSSSTKDQHLFSRRKSKDAHKDGPRSSREQENKVKKVDRVPSSPDSSKTADTSNHAEINSEALDSARKNAPQSSAPAASNVASSSADSPRNNSDDDAGTKGPLHRTLPGLIAEIMSKGQRMTYEELCNAVLPHWHNLRKHNGERYAYSSPSQAVLDCLRNRAEWAQLVDRGPKTNASRKRRKLDSEGQNTESEDNEYAEGRNLKRGGIKNLESSREEFPKGKRNARKRRRLALQGRNVKDVRKRRKAKVVSDDDSPSSSNSSEQSAYTEDGSEAGAVGDAGSEDSASSDETGNTL